MNWKTASERPAWDEQPMRQFIRLEGSCTHHGDTWARVFCGEAWIRKPGTEDELLGYRKSDIERLCRDGDIDIETAEVTHWMPAIFPDLPRPPKNPLDQNDIRNFMRPVGERLIGRARRRRDLISKFALIATRQ